jgi:hypothetical protein
MAPTVEQFIASCRAEVGFKESPVNRTKFAAMAHHPDGAAWCHTFLVGEANATGLSIPHDVAATAYTPSGAAAWKAAGRWFTVPQPGDWGYADFPGDGVNRISHVVLIVAVHPDGTVSTIEGNTSIGSSGSQREGLWVAAKKRDRSIFKGYGRPQYATAAAPAPKPGPAVVIVKAGTAEDALMKAYPHLFGARTTRILTASDVAATNNPEDIALGVAVWGTPHQIRGKDRYETLRAALAWR